MDDTRELKQAYDIFTAAWRIYKAHYPPKDLKDRSRIQLPVMQRCFLCGCL